MSGSTHRLNPWAATAAILVLIAATVALRPASVTQAAQTGGDFSSMPASVSGYLSIVWADGANGQSQVRYYLTNPGQTDLELDFSAGLPVSYERLLALRGYPVSVSGSQLAGGGLRVSALAPVYTASAPADVNTSGAQPWVTLMCKFSDISSEPKSATFFQNMYGSTYPLLDHYWREQSYNQINIGGSQAISAWVTLPQPRSYYIGTSANLTQLVNDCTAAANATVNFPTFVGINMMFNSDLDGYAWGGSRYLTLDGATRLWYLTWEPPWGYNDVTVIAHEMGHGFGLPHSSFNRSSVYDNRWDVMSDTWSDCNNLRDATYGCLGQHTIAYHKDLLGWLSARKTTVSSGSRSQVTLEQLAQPQTTNLQYIKVPIGTTNQYYTVEARRKVGYDVKLPGAAIIIHKVDPSQSIPATLVDPTSDLAGGMWILNETFTDSTNHITISVDAVTATGFTITVSNNYGGTPATLTPTPTATVATKTFTPTPKRSPTPTRTPNPNTGQYPYKAFIPGVMGP